jgi:hypothetical protein
MPFTFAHPAAVLPLRKYCPKLFSLPALVVGSLMPDLGYYLHNWIWSICGHSFSGSLTFDLPAGAIVLSLFYLTIRPVARLLPYPHREACSAICPAVTLPGFRSILVALVSLLIGAWTHIIWDGFTHAGGWCVRQFAAVTPPLVTLGGCQVTVWHVLQHSSTILGLVLLVTAYTRYVRGRRFLRHRALLGSGARTLIYTLVLILPAVRAVLDNAGIFMRGFSLLKMDEFIFNATVNYIYTFIPLVCVMGVIVSILEYLFVSRQQRPLPGPQSRSLPLPVSSGRGLPLPALKNPPVVPALSGRAETVTVSD